MKSLFVGVLCFVASSAHGAIYTVGPNKMFRTLQIPLLVGQPGDTVVIDPGTYVENVVIKRGMTLMSSGGERQPFTIAAPAASNQSPVIIDGVPTGELLTITDMVIQGTTRAQALRVTNNNGSVALLNSEARYSGNLGLVSLPSATTLKSNHHVYLSEFMLDGLLLQAWTANRIGLAAMEIVDSRVTLTNTNIRGFSYSATQGGLGAAISGSTLMMTNAGLAGGTGLNGLHRISMTLKSASEVQGCLFGYGAGWEYLDNASTLYACINSLYRHWVTVNNLRTNEVRLGDRIDYHHMWRWYDMAPPSKRYWSFVSLQPKFVKNRWHYREGFGAIDINQSIYVRTGALTRDVPAQLWGAQIPTDRSLIGLTVFSQSLGEHIVLRAWTPPGGLHSQPRANVIRPQRLAFAGGPNGPVKPTFQVAPGGISHCKTHHRLEMGKLGHCTHVK